ncbi:G patch domain-containing protein 8-like isoform X1 [Acipenser ruthenus]|uniref:G patch domain-containing protein 8-like isoform X1 n=1 Tax=Acipenser ruthenus TaxID=7906 RepID=UPI0027413592|nr:G patch domain-containing protein 8-like isoform X1 [Acipenser ruthenus]
MACYYLVISSTHLSNGHFRSIKGVFRGPLCKTTGSELPDYAEKEKAIANALEDLKANFYCELCDKQYHKHQEFDNHINSYDHAHKQRLKELKQREFARNVASKSWKDEKKQEKALKRLHQLAELRKQSECGPGSGPMFRATTVAAEDQQQERTFTEKDVGNGNRYILIGDPQDPQELPVTKERLHKSIGKIGIQLAEDYNNQRAGVSFCFSKKAQLKLESSASVFSDTTEEANDREELQSQKGKQTAETFRAQIPSPGHPADEKELKEQQMDNKTQNKQGKDPEFHQSPSAHNITDKEDFPLIVFTGSFENTDLSHGPKADLDNNESNASNCFAARDHSSKDTHAEGDSSYQQRKVLIEEFLNTEPDTLMIIDSDKMKPDESLGDIRVADDECASKQAYGDSDGLTKTVGPFLDVLNKDGSMMLKWPSELLLHTKTEPCISYSCNPLYFDFKHSRKKHIIQDGTLSVEIDYCNVDMVDEKSKGTIVEWQTHNQETNQSAFFKPKKVKHSKARQTLKLKLEAVNKARSSCKHNIKSKDGRGLEYKQRDATQNESVNAKRFGFKKRKRSLNDECSNESDVAEQSKKNKNNPFSPSEDMGQNFYEEAPETGGQVKSKNNFLDSMSNIGDSKKEIYRKSVSDKSSSYSSYLEIDTDSEEGFSQGWRCSSSFESSERGSSSRTYGITSSCSRTYSSCRSSDDSTSRNSHHCSARKSHQDYKNTHWHKMKNYSSSEETNDDDEYFRHSRSRKRKRTREHGTKSRSRSSYSSTSGQSSDWKRCSHLSSSSSRRSHRSDTTGSKSRHSCTNSDRKLSQRRSRSFSRDRLYCSKKKTLAKNRETVKDTGRQHQTETGNPAQSSSRKYAINCHKKRFPADKINADKNLLDKFQPKKSYEEKTHPSKILNISSVKLKDQSQVCFGSSTPLLLTNAPALPLIGKLPAAKRNSKKQEHNRNKSRDKEEALKNNEIGALIGSKQSETRLPEGEVRECNLQSPEVVLIEGQLLHTKGKELSVQNYYPGLQGLPEACSFSVNSTEEEKTQLPNTGIHFASREGATQYPLKTKMQNVEETEPQFESSKCVLPPLTEQPITFAPDEIDKYRLLQLQAQQHMQQQLLGKRVKVLPSPAEVPTFSPAPAFPPIPLQQPNPITSIRQALIQQHAVAAFTSALHPHGNLQPLAHIHPFPQSHFTPISLSPFAPAMFSAHPAALLAGHPLHFVPASSFHPAHPALHPMSHSSLLPTLLAPSPSMAAATAASALYLHPYLHPLFPGQDLQPHSRPST